MYTIIDKIQLTEGIFKMIIKAPHIAKSWKPGQFVVLMVNEIGERIPLTIVDGNTYEETITLIFQVVGKTTALLASKNVGEQIYSIMGPLGKPSEIKRYGKVALIGGGVGAAEILPQARALKQVGNYVISIVGARSSSKLILVEELKSFCDEVHVCTDDGSYGFKGFVSDALSNLIEEGYRIDYVYAVGPVPMMKAVSKVTFKHKIKTVVSANPIMIDGTGMCGVCRVIVGGEIKFACIDGPDFDAHLLDFDTLESRLKTYIKHERKAFEDFMRCQCHG
ncbi:MAG: sulfide/dihydroorotate dehydrogenase-like FAD/NAD-binding protein [Nitrososphaeria archaeon]|nr:sulfide/dihydroorotate dehydrogenase-like FAD/NAD-binding protein [Nitrososphaeria archaeon]